MNYRISKQIPYTYFHYSIPLLTLLELVFELVGPAEGGGRTLLGAAPPLSIARK